MLAGPKTDISVLALNYVISTNRIFRIQTVTSISFTLDLCTLGYGVGPLLAKPITTYFSFPDS